MPASSFTLKQLITYCTDIDGSKRELAWREFFRRYKKLIFYFIERSCNQWSLSRLQLQKRDVLDDVLSEVLIMINKNLADFKNQDSEKKFIAWLQVVCNRTCSIYLKRVFKNNISEVDILDIPLLKKGHEDIIMWELHEFMVETLRSELPNSTKNLERDINIFLLNVWFGFPTEQITEHPCYNHLTHDSIKSIVTRIKKNVSFL